MREKCPCQGDYLEKFIQPAILLLLYEAPAHGFKLLNEIKERGLVCRVDATGFYRTLKQLEEGGKVSSSWDLAPGQRARRVYAITGEGKQCLETWKSTLHSYRDSIEELLTEIDKTLQAQD